MCFKLKKTDAEQQKSDLIKKGAIDFDYEPCRDENYVYFAVKKKVPGYEYAEMELRKRTKKSGDLRSLLKGKLTDEEIEKMVASYDVIGDIAVLDIPDELKKSEKIIAQEILMKKNIDVVAKRQGSFSGIYRIRRIVVIAGENRTLTVHKEHGCRFYVDLNKVYFSPRLSFERKRICDLVEKNEKILALFAGVGPYPIIIAKKHPDAEIVAVELNPEAVKLMKRNVEMNKVNLRIIEGDVKEVLRKDEFMGWADRIIMPLPKDAEHFLDVCFDAASGGCMIHFYHFSPIENAFDAAIEIIKKVAKEKGKKIEIIGKRIVRPFSPKTVQVVIDFRVLG